MIIQTKYKGYYFRSRLEARWAVFFDTLGIKWEYEKEGFTFENGISYLPDFWLPELNMWAEVKAEEFTEEEKLKCRLLAKETKKDVLELTGMPEVIPYKRVMYQLIDNKHDWFGIKDYIFEIMNFHLPEKYIKYLISFDPDKLILCCNAYYRNAIEKSKSARFEFNNA
jgi:hypothetical protein